MSITAERRNELENKYPMLRYFSDRSFGVEIECYGLDYVITPLDNSIIKPYNISSTSKDGRPFFQVLRETPIKVGGDRNSWHFEQDGSITSKSGVELVSPILTGTDGLAQVYHALQMLCSLKKLAVNESCGFHVHHGVDRRIFKCRQLQELMRIVYPMEDYLYWLIPGDRRNNTTCRPIEIDLKEFSQACDDECGEDKCRLKELWYSSENQYDPSVVRDRRYDRTRYHGLNFHSYWYRSTIEFRYHSAVLHNYKEAIQWIIFTQVLVELSQGSAPTITMDGHASKWMRALYKVYLASGHLDRIKQPHS